MWKSSNILFDVYKYIHLKSNNNKIKKKRRLLQNERINFIFVKEICKHRRLGISKRERKYTFFIYSGIYIFVIFWREMIIMAAKWFFFVVNIILFLDVNQQNKRNKKQSRCLKCKPFICANILFLFCLRKKGKKNIFFDLFSHIKKYVNWIAAKSSSIKYYVEYFFFYFFF